MSHRLFVAVWPPEWLVEQLAGLPRPAVPGIRWTTADQWHVTLRFIGSVADPAEAEAALAEVEVGGPVTAEAGPATERMSRSVLCLPVGALEQLALAVREVSAGVGQPPDDRPFRGHLTLARGKPGVDLRPLAGTRLGGSWPVEDITLVSSDTRPQGARYTVLARKPI